MSQETKKGKRKDATKKESPPSEPSEPSKKEKIPENDDAEETKPKYGPSVTFPYQRVWCRCILLLGVLFVVWYNSKNGKEVSLARQKDILLSRSQNVQCSDDFKAELEKFQGCTPEKCKRVVSDKLVSAAESDVLLKIAINGMSLGGSDGGASILDLHSGALSKGTGFINVYTLDAAKKIFKSADFAIYKVVKTKIHHAIAHNFGVDADKVYLTHPTFFSRMTSAPAKTIHDEYWHPHVDKETYKSFHYTSILYLSDYDRDFEGGRFIFVDQNNVNTTMQPRKGRVLMFTSGSENLHAVEKVTSGTRYALTISFTCDPQYVITDPSLKNIQQNNH
ncbi:2-oxoglutarate and iron-dependent oxygenase domain-containing protein 3-like [Orussus abietinus]|uniref:2-oxoglutarate and iron-dependent oxygenase domain-containing protein 3-like n=1 Tax=Orussus abietinus TaxID=222816 RepID=UPI000625F877|nr:2-oxoglutarate and iron-dependent oxygenase domain-containing protein 3-like [Orussus abietinus]